MRDLVHHQSGFPAGAAVPVRRGPRPELRRMTLPYRHLLQMFDRRPSVEPKLLIRISILSSPGNRDGQSEFDLNALILLSLPAGAVNSVPTDLRTSGSGAE